MEKMSNKVNQINALDGEKGIQYLLNRSSAIIGNPIAMFNTEYNLQAYTHVVTDDPFWNELVTYGNYSYESQVFFREEGFIDAVANAKTVALLVSDKLKYERMSGKLYNENNVHVSNLNLVACKKPFSPDDPAIFEAICKKFSREISKNKFYQTYGSLYQENYIRKLIDGGITDKMLYAAHIAIVYNGFHSSMRLVVACIGKNQSGSVDKLIYYRDLFKLAQSDFEYALYAHYVLIIISSDHSKLDTRRDLGRLYDLFEQHDIHAGISSCFDNLYELRKYYNEAETALIQGLNQDSGGRFYLYDEMES